MQLVNWILVYLQYSSHLRTLTRVTFWDYDYSVLRPGTSRVRETAARNNACISFSSFERRFVSWWCWTWPAGWGEWSWPHNNSSSVLWSPRTLTDTVGLVCFRSVMLALWDYNNLFFCFRICLWLLREEVHNRSIKCTYQTTKQLLITLHNKNVNCDKWEAVRCHTNWFFVSPYLWVWLDAIWFRQASQFCEGSRYCCFLDCWCGWKFKLWVNTLQCKNTYQHCWQTSMNMNYEFGNTILT